MNVLKNRTTRKRDKARRAVAKQSKAAKKSVRRWRVKKAVQNLASTRLAVAAAGAFAAVAGAVALKKRKGSSAPPAYTPPVASPTPPTPPSTAPPVPPAPPAAPPETTPELDITPPEATPPPTSP